MSNNTNVLVVTGGCFLAGVMKLKLPSWLTALPHRFSKKGPTGLHWLQSPNIILALSLSSLATRNNAWRALLLLFLALCNYF